MAAAIPLDQTLGLLEQLLSTDNAVMPVLHNYTQPILLSVLPSLPFTLHSIQARKQAESNFNQLQGNTDAFVQAFVQVLVEMFFVLYVPHPLRSAFFS
jgi:hypothetical protein